MKFSANPIEASLEDIMMTAVHLAATELAQMCPQPEGDSIELWKGYLLQQAIKLQGQMSEEERFIFSRDVLCKWGKSDREGTKNI